MARTASDKPLDVPVQVRFTAAGTPLAVRYDGRIWAVAAEPVRWFTRADWWNTAKRAQVGCGDLVSVEHWQVQVRLTSTSALRTFEVRRDPLSEKWLLTAITDTGSVAA
ncbi:hypothetical protein [Arthrobacter rhizosphaerae]|uniref:hypothetical protein n=1 Tax=Arthrobacter rhizosphaerae TaxID=2855490 RepID=UPI001FF171CB|nr:hypothetical protein [Arthrobacter rhizosphaerae]